MKKMSVEYLDVLNEHWDTRRFVRGMTDKEISNLLKALKLKQEEFDKNLGVNTVAVDKETAQFLWYYRDIERTIRVLCGGKTSTEEWD